MPSKIPLSIFLCPSWRRSITLDTSAPFISFWSKHRFFYWHLLHFLCHLPDIVTLEHMALIRKHCLGKLLGWTVRFPQYILILPPSSSCGVVSISPNQTTPPLPSSCSHSQVPAWGQDESSQCAVPAVMAACCHISLL